MTFWLVVFTVLSTFVQLLQWLRVSTGGTPARPCSSPIFNCLATSNVTSEIVELVGLVAR